MQVLEIFSQICQIPRPSKHEERISQWLQDFAREHHIECVADEAMNVILRVPATAGYEDHPTLILQAHMDMVCEKNSDCDHNFMTDPIETYVDGDWLKARGTTLGADNGIGIAMALAAITDPDLQHPAIECLFTVDEETGLTGAMKLQDGYLKGTRLINLDSEDEGQLFVGCAGGIDTTAIFKYGTEKPADGSAFLKFRVFNALGGHSGDDINKERANTVQILARFLYSELPTGYQLAWMKGGNKRNAIAREAEAVIAVPSGAAEGIRARFASFADEVKAEFHRTDPDVSFEVIENEPVAECVEADVARRFVLSLMAVHHGVLAMSQDIDGLVETSSNLAAVFMNKPGEIMVTTSQRSSVESEKAFMAQKVESAFLLAGAEISHSDPYPGWTPDMNSHILAETVASYRRLFGVEPEVKAIHAGLECGLFLTKFPDLDMISFGPTLRGVHAPGEKLDLESNEKFVKLLVDVVTNFK